MMWPPETDEGQWQPISQGSYDAELGCWRHWNWLGGRWVESMRMEDIGIEAVWESRTWKVR